MSDPALSGRLPFPPGEPEFPWRGSPDPGSPAPGFPAPGAPRQPGAPEPGALPPTRIWLDPPPDAGWRDAVYERLLERRIVLASGVLDEATASRLSAQLLTLDAEGAGGIRLELQNMQAELPAAVTLMGVLDVLRAQVTAHVSGEAGGAALGVLASCPRRLAYPNASFTLSEPRLRLRGTADEVSAREQQVRRMADSLVYRIAEATGRDAADVREDARRGRVLTVAEAIGYGLVHDRVARRP